MKKAETLAALSDRHRSPSANEIYSSARVYLQSSKPEKALSPVDLPVDTVSPDKGDHKSSMRVAFANGSTLDADPMSSSKHMKDIPRPTRLRSKSAISENEVPSNESQMNMLNPVILERSKTVAASDGMDITSHPPLSFSPNELVVPMNYPANRSSPGNKEMASIRKKLFTSSSQDVSVSGGSLLGSATAPATMLRGNIPPRHNGGQASAPSSLTVPLMAPDQLSIITTASGVVLDGVTSNEGRTMSEGGADGRRRNGKKYSEKEHKSLSGVRRPPLSKDKIIKKSNRDNNELSLLDLSSEDAGTSPPTGAVARPRRNSNRTVEPIAQRPVIDKKALGKTDVPDSLPPKQQQLIPVRSLSDHLAGHASSSSREGSSEGLPSPSMLHDEEEGFGFASMRASPGDGKLKVPAPSKSRENSPMANSIIDTAAPPSRSLELDCNLSYSESESGGAPSGSQGELSQDTPHRPHDNDDILLQRIQEAQALNRKEVDNGAVMHKFSLWSNVNPTNFRPTQSHYSNDETVAPDKKTPRVRGPRAAIKNDGDAIPGKDDSPPTRDDSTRISSSTVLSRASSTSNHSVSVSQGEQSNTLPADGTGSMNDEMMSSGGTPLSTGALGASGAMAMALRNMVGSAKQPNSPNVHDFDGEEFSYLNTCGSVDSLDDADALDYMSSMDNTEMLSRATSVEMEEDNDYGLQSEEEDTPGRRNSVESICSENNAAIQHYISPAAVMVTPMAVDVTALATGVPEDIIPEEVNSNENLIIKSALKKKGDSVQSKAGNRAESPERSAEVAREGVVYATPPRSRPPMTSQGESGSCDRVGVFVHQSSPHAASARRPVAEAGGMRAKKNMGLSLDQMKDSNAEKTSISSPGKKQPPSEHGEISNCNSDDRSVDFTLRERRKHQPKSILGCDGSERDGSRVGSASSGMRQQGGRKPAGKQQIPWVRGEPIGQGTFGRVYRGMNEGTGELLAVKQICLVDGADGEVDSLRGEIRLMKSLDHANIVRYLGTSVSERYLFIIMEYVPGGSIAGMLSQFGAFSEPLISRFIRQILCGVVYLHGKGIIHRDIKGANVLVTDVGVAKLADFGCSKQLVGLTTASLEENLKSISGSVPWMAPEVIKQTGHGLSADIWSVGATVIEMITAKHPWQEFTNSLAALFHVATSDVPPAFPPKISSSLKSFLGSCLVINSENRSTAVELQDHQFVATAKDGKS